MAVTSDVVGQGTLTTSASTIRTGAGTENHVFTFRNKGGASRTLTVWINGSADVNEQFAIVMADGDTIVFRCKLGNADTVQAKSSDDANSIHWTDEMDDLS